MSQDSGRIESRRYIGYWLGSLNILGIIFDEDRTWSLIAKDVMIKIAHFITDLSIGGAQMMLYKLLSRIDRETFHCRVVSLSSPYPIGNNIMDSGIQTDSLGLKRGMPTPQACYKAIRILLEWRPDIIQTWLYHADLLGILISKATQVGQVAWNVRCSAMDLSHYRKLTAWTVKACAMLSSLPAAVITNSHTAKEDHVMMMGYHPNHFEVIPNGFDIVKFKPDQMARTNIRRALGIPENIFAVGCLGRFDPKKDHATFLKAAARVYRELSKVRFVLCGEGVSRDNGHLLKQINALGLSEHTLVLGPRNDMPEILAGLDLYCSSSSFGEGFPNVICEAMACGLPCVVTDVGDSARIVGDTGIVVSPKNPEALARGMRRLLTLTHGERKERGLSARKRIENNYALEKIVKQYEKLYLNMINRTNEKESSILYHGQTL